jgi:hypothetical protein
MAGWPLTLNMAVNGTNSLERRKSSHGSSLQASISPIGTGRRASAGVRTTSLEAHSERMPRESVWSCDSASR